MYIYVYLYLYTSLYTASAFQTTSRTHLTVIQLHLKLLEVHVLLCFGRLQIVIEVPSSEPERMKSFLGRQEQRRRRLLVAHSRITTFPSPHHVDAVGIASKGERVSAVGRAEIDRGDDQVFARRRRIPRRQTGVVRSWNGVAIRRRRS